MESITVRSWELDVLLQSMTELLTWKVFLARDSSPSSSTRSESSWVANAPCSPFKSSLTSSGKSTAWLQNSRHHSRRPGKSWAVSLLNCASSGGRLAIVREEKPVRQKGLRKFQLKKPRHNRIKSQKRYIASATMSYVKGSNNGWSGADEDSQKCINDYQKTQTHFLIWITSRREQGISLLWIHTAGIV